MSPWHRLPSEILSQIFIDALPKGFDLSTHHAPLLLERVCKRWKDVTHSTPALWCRISIQLRPENDLRRQLKMVSICLDRSGRHPLSIKLESQGIDASDLQSGQPVVSLLVAESERWHTVQLQLPSRVFRELTGVKGKLSSLRSLHIRTFDNFADEYPTTLDIFAFAPDLKNFRASWYFSPVGDIHGDIISTSSFAIPWNNLTILVIDRREPAIVWNILQNSSNLVEFDATIHLYGRINVPELPTVILPHLRSLSLRYLNQQLDGMLATLIVPVLEEAIFTTVSSSGDYPESYTLSHPWHVRSGLDILLSQSKCTLRRLKLRSLPTCLQTYDLSACLEALPSLTELDVGNGVSPFLIQSIIDHPNSTSPHLIPNLKKLVLVTGTSFAWNLFASFLKSRWVTNGQSQRLQSLRLTTDANGLEAGAREGIWDALRIWKSKGMDIEVINSKDWSRWL